MSDKAAEYQGVTDAVELLEDEGFDVLEAEPVQRPVGGIMSAFEEAFTGSPATETVVDLTVRGRRIDTDDRPPYPEPPTEEELKDSHPTDCDVDDRAARIRATVGGEDHTDVVREKELFKGLPDDIEIYVDRVDVYDTVDEAEALSRVLRSIYGDNPQAPPKLSGAEALLEKLAHDDVFDDVTLADAVIEAGWNGSVSWPATPSGGDT